MTLSIVTKTLKDGNGVNFTGQFATDGTNFWPLAVLVNEQGNIITNSTGLPIAAASLPLPSGAATSSNQPAINVDGGALAHVTNFPTVAQASGQNAASPSIELVVGGQFNTTPTTITSGNASPLQLDNAGNLLVNIKAGAAAGGTSSNFGSSFPTAGTASGLEYLSSPPTLTSGNMGAFQGDVNGNLKQTLTASTGTSTFACIGVSGTGTGPLLTNSAQAIKSSAGTLYRIRGYNSNVAIVWIQLFDLAVGSVTLGTTVPKDPVPLLPNAGFDELLSADFGSAYLTAITAAACTSPTNGTAPTTGITCTFYYK